MADPPDAMGMHMDPELDQLLELEMCLGRVRSYARALEERCNRLWGYIPGNQGTADPTLAFLAAEHGVTDADMDRAS